MLHHSVPEFSCKSTCRSYPNIGSLHLSWSLYIYRTSSYISFLTNQPINQSTKMSILRTLNRALPRLTPTHSTPFASTSSIPIRHYASRSSFTRPGPPPLPPADQAEFEAQQKAAQTVGATPASTLLPGEISKEADIDLEKHRDLRRGPIPEFMGDRNPKTGEQGGPKVDPFKSTEGDWSYAGRVTVSGDLPF
jgi:hypothetical protein